jgi:hypothetical protein
LLAAALVLFVSGSLAANGQDGQERSPVDVLLQARQVDDAAVGFAAKRTQLYAAFAQLYGQRTLAVDGAKRLVRDGTPAGRVYGYIVLHHAAADQAQAYGRTLRDDVSEVTVQSGCVGVTRTVGELVRAVDRGELVIAVPPSPLEDPVVPLTAP